MFFSFLFLSLVAMDAIMDNLHQLGNSSVKAQSMDLLFLKEVMQSRVMQNLVKVRLCYLLAT